MLKMNRVWIFELVMPIAFVICQSPIQGVDMKKNLTHEARYQSLDSAAISIIDKLRARNDLSESSLSIEMKFIEALSQSELGKFLMCCGGLNGYWTDYLVKYPERKTNDDVPLPEINDFLLNDAPSCLATQQRYQIFKTEIRKRLRDDISLATVPCGLMGELLDLDYSGYQNILLTGIDTDTESLQHAYTIASELGLEKNCHLLNKNAWALDIHYEFDILISNGLNIYEYDDDKTIALYREFFEALKPGGILITSFLTPPPTIDRQSSWDMSQIDPHDLRKQKILFVDILEAKWQAYRTESEIQDQLETAGFTNCEIIYDKARIFPTIVAKKPV